METNLDTPFKKTWCPGCGNFGILEGIKKAVASLEEEGMKRENFVLTTGIGCFAKIVDYININTFYGLHGRSLPVATGMKIANPSLKVLACSGDGDSYNEGLAHIIFAAKRNIDITVIIHDNRAFALTVGQFTAISPKGYKGKSTPEGSTENPFNPLDLLFSAGATFIARSYSANLDHLQKIIAQGVKHKGFSLIEVLQPCVAWSNTYETYNERVYEFENQDVSSKENAAKRIKEWDYRNGDKIPIGIFYKSEESTLDEQLVSGLTGKKADIKEALKEFK
ncbi:2-oxoacid:ferredoxin oxidoreductase subunit beta [Candidatus Parcubacteria bacterium]|nr:2-oxoacid:ferredoxin oxidoreductase subunit beta [Candidatus Parcubacteria bacterium]